MLAQDVDDNTPSMLRASIGSDLVLLDKQSTADLFTNPAHVKNIRPAKMLSRVHCNKGSMATTEEAEFGDMPIYLNSHGIASVLSLSIDLAKSLCHLR